MDEEIKYITPIDKKSTMYFVTDEVGQSFIISSPVGFHPLQQSWMCSPDELIRLAKK